MEGSSSKKPYLAVLLVQAIYAGMFLLSKAAFDVGMNNFVFVFYRQAVATVFLAPLAFYFEWKKAPSLTLATFCKIFFLSLCGITMSLDIYGVALVYTSATLAAATTNSLPVITFVLAVLLRMEVLKLKTGPGIAKLVGIVVCIGGVTTMAFYKGPHISLWCHHLFNSPHHQVEHHISSGITWIKGCFLMLISNMCWAFWLVLQAPIIKSYPSKLLLTTLQCFLSSIQSLLIAIPLARDPAEWKLGWNVRLIAVAYCGIVVTGLTYYLQAWIIEKRGAVFLAMSTPLSLVMTMFVSVAVLCEAVSLGSVIGGLLLVGGLYSVLWGKSREQRMEDASCMDVEAEKQFSENKEQEDATTKITSPILPV